MAEDLSQWVEYAPDGTPRAKPGVGALLPMNRTPAATGKAATGKATEPKRKATGDRFRTLNAFVDGTLAGLSRSEIAVWLVLFRDVRDGTARTSQENLAKRSGTSVRHVKKAVASLTAAGLLTVVYQGGLNRGPSRFRVNSLGTRRS